MYKRFSELESPCDVCCEVEANKRVGPYQGYDMYCDKCYLNHWCGGDEHKRDSNHDWLTESESESDSD